MGSRLVQFVLLAEIQDDFLALLQLDLVVDEMDEEAADGVEDDVLGQRLVDPHGAGFLLVLLALFLACTPHVLHGFTQEASSVLDEAVLMVIRCLKGCCFVVFLGDCLLELECDDFLEDVLPNGLFAPDSVVVDLVEEPPFVDFVHLVSLAVDSLVVLFEVKQLTHVQN